MARTGLLLAVLALSAGCRGRPAPGVLGRLPDFRLESVGPAGESPFGLRDLLGRVWVADFVYTRCEGPCPMLSQRLSGLSRELPQAVGLLSVTVDPEGDTPGRLREYARSFGAEPGRWFFLRGTWEETARLMTAGFRLPLAQEPGAPAASRLQHSTRLALIDRSGALRGYYDGTSDAETAALTLDARRLLDAR